MIPGKLYYVWNTHYSNYEKYSVMSYRLTNKYYSMLNNLPTNSPVFFIKEFKNEYYQILYKNKIQYIIKDYGICFVEVDSKKL